MGFRWVRLLQIVKVDRCWLRIDLQQYEASGWQKGMSAASDEAG